MLKPPLQALLCAPGVAMWSDLVLGRKTITIREGHRDYRPGPVMLCCHLASVCVMADVAEVRHCRLDEVTDEELRDDGFADREHLLSGLRRFYPSLGLESAVTVIRLDGFRGTLVDQRMLVMAPKNRTDDPLVARFEDQG